MGRRTMHRSCGRSIPAWTRVLWTRFPSGDSSRGLRMGYRSPSKPGLKSTSTYVRPKAALAAFAVMLAACAAHRTRVAAEPPAPDNAAYIDLEPGWRLRVVTPILKSGGYRLQTSSPEAAGGSISASAEGFIGFETAYYSVTQPVAGVLSIEFLSATITKDGATTPQPRPLVHLFDLPEGVRFVRLVYLTRSSQADHDMAVVASEQRVPLDAVTSEMQANPAASCSTRRGVFCAWVPAGIAVRAELRTPGSSEWTP